MLLLNLLEKLLIKMTNITKLMMQMILMFNLDIFVLLVIFMLCNIDDSQC